MAKAPLEIKSLAREHTGKALSVLAHVMNAPGAPHAARVAAAQALLDRGWGKAPQAIVGSDDEPGVKLHHVIEQVIVDGAKD